ncbi:MAG TPA: hypothetical protein PLG43_09735 [Spirochaetia bacterium]|jgi:hypothetical protein|nr:hypothetical protein [Spirochaetia bacterium]
MRCIFTERENKEPRKRVDVMQTGIFYVKVRENPKESFQDFFPHMSLSYTNMAKLFEKNKKYPVLAVEKVVIIKKDGTEAESARFLVPTENGNFIWILSELFTFAGLATDDASDAGVEV